MNDKMIRALDYVLFSILGLFAFLYVEGSRRFAETHVQFGFLSFPVFIGEFLLLACLILLFVRIYLQPIKFNAWHGLIGLYFVFVVGKALIGFRAWGPLAFRDAAMFYYFAFAIVGYYCYRPEYFNRFAILFFYAILAAILILKVYPLYWVFAIFILSLALAYRYPDRRVGLAMAALIIVVTPYHYFVDTARMMVLGNFVASIFLIVTLSIFVKQKAQVKYPVIAGLIILLGLSFFYFSNNKKAQSVLRVKDFIELFKEQDQTIQAQKPTFKFKDRSAPLLYHPEADVVEELLAATAAMAAQTEPAISADTVKAENSLSSQEGAAYSLTQQIKPGLIGPRNDLNNGVFRLLIWRDMWEDWKTTKPVFGVDFGKPFRSVSLEILGWAECEWSRDGWVAAHNSFWNMIYRSGLFGVAVIAVFWSVFIWMTAQFIRHRSMVGIFLSSILLNWFVAAHFLLIFELPYTAIPVWILYGVTLAYAHRLPGNNVRTEREFKK